MSYAQPFVWKRVDVVSGHVSEPHARRVQLFAEANEFFSGRTCDSYVQLLIQQTRQPLTRNIVLNDPVPAMATFDRNLKKDFLVRGLADRYCLCFAMKAPHYLVSILT